MTWIENLIYRQGGERGLLDVLRPAGTGPFPAVVCIHGGGWIEGSKLELRHYAVHLSTLGIATVLPNYRLAGTDPHPAQLDDLFAVLQWMADHAAEYTFDIGRVGLTGASAGGHLAALLGLLAGRTRPTPCTIRCMLPVCGVYDVAQWLADKPKYRNHVEALVGGEPERCVSVMRDASPISHVYRDAPPSLCLHGRLDTVVPVNQTELFVTALEAAGANVQRIVTPIEGHTATAAGTEGREPLGGLRAFTDFFREHLL